MRRGDNGDAFTYKSQRREWRGSLHFLLVSCSSSLSAPRFLPSSLSSLSPLVLPLVAGVLLSAYRRLGLASAALDSPACPHSHRLAIDDPWCRRSRNGWTRFHHILVGQEDGLQRRQHLRLAFFAVVMVREQWPVVCACCVVHSSLVQVLPAQCRQPSAPVSWTYFAICGFTQQGEGRELTWQLPCRSLSSVNIKSMNRLDSCDEKMADPSSTADCAMVTKCAGSLS